jgi:transcriptional regulator with XRE-family HTH domain
MPKKTQVIGETKDPAFTAWARSATVGERLRWLLEHRGMSQVDLARTMKNLSSNDPQNLPKQSRAATTQSAISNVVTNASRKPNAPTLLRMAAALQASPEWIMTGDGHPFETSTISRKTERDLLGLFRDMTPAAQEALIAAARAMTRK